MGKKTIRGGGGEEGEKEWLEFLPPDAASLRSSEPSSYVYRALGRGRGSSAHCQVQAAKFGWGWLWGRGKQKGRNRKGVLTGTGGLGGGEGAMTTGLGTISGWSPAGGGCGVDGGRSGSGKEGEQQRGESCMSVSSKLWPWQPATQPGRGDGDSKETVPWLPFPGYHAPCPPLAATRKLPGAMRCPSPSKRGEERKPGACSALGIPR